MSEQRSENGCGRFGRFVGVKVEPAQHAALVRLAAARDTTVSALIREAAGMLLAGAAGGRVASR